ncbi:AraC family transcriptional regulator [Parachitinimonas caeni]|uniref:AraC family transcriptional regulator n=1 Tax=Parachitinimonas caeni TaxID=3031301 RepID=A0ABT7DWH6_9NEIS|nr:AraC family transcriptional regulator [Parachitinimonas caeni]MDK2124179.1 AraC family transcriptional regulator [Parachitinimonas caeni]
MQSSVTPDHSERQVRIPASYTRLMARELKLDKDGMVRLLAGSGVRPDDLQHADATLTLAQHEVTVRNAKALSGDAGLGLIVGSALSLSSHGAAGYAATTSADLGEALRTVTRYLPLRAPYLSAQFEVTEDLAIWRVEPAIELGDNLLFLLEVVFLALQSLLEFTAGGLPPGCKVTLGLPAPRYAERYRQVFRMPIQFGASQHSLILPAACLNIPCASADAPSHRGLRLQCEQALQALNQPGGGLAQQVRAYLAERLQDSPCIDQAARHFHLSSRTLVRRLAADATTFQTLLDEVRRGQASELLAVRLPIDSIAELLGYRDPSNFGRAFRRWFGMSPSAYRNQHHQNG